MEALIDHGEVWMEPLLEFREYLSITTDPKRKREFRDIKGRDGRVILKKDGTPAARTYKFKVSKQMLEDVLRAEQALRREGPDPNVTLISHEELFEIRRIWRTERQDWDDSARAVFRRVSGADLDWPVDDNTLFDSDHKALLRSLCAEHQVPFDLIAKMLEAERRMNGMARRAGIQQALDKVLGHEWRSEEEILAGEDSASRESPAGKGHPQLGQA